MTSPGTRRPGVTCTPAIAPNRLARAPQGELACLHEANGPAAPRSAACPGGCVALAAATSALAARQVVLGSADFAPNGTGFGTSHPRRIYNGGDANGSAFDIHWYRWGGHTRLEWASSRCSNQLAATTGCQCSQGFTASRGDAAIPAARWPTPGCTSAARPVRADRSAERTCGAVHIHCARGTPDPLV
jgi:hypothetical protein